MTPGLMSMIEEMTNKKVSSSNIHDVPKKYMFTIKNPVSDSLFQKRFYREKIRGRKVS